ncbi:MAG: gliding motility-associated C-terminal domain-containing protein [Flavobacteriales bacterium]|nr:gliding motility-associated C-terminal domain-containing protein [Flavobacteriales bacterium]
MKITLIHIFLFTTLFVKANENSPLKFQENKGQWDEKIHYMAQIPSGKLFVENGTLTYTFVHEEDIHRIHDIHHGHYPNPSEKDMQIRMHAYKIQFENSNPNATFKTNKTTPDYVNYFIGNDSAKWAGRVKQYGELTCQSLYQGIDMKMYFTKGKIKYDLIVHAGSNPKDIKLNYSGTDKLFLKRGSLYIKTSVNEVIEKKPFAFQKVNGQLRQIPCNYVLKGNTLSFSFPAGYDKNYELIIDPVLIFSTYTGSSADNWGFTATYDSQGNLYAGGICFNFGYPTTVGAFQTTFALGSTDIAISKFNSTGNALLYSTYLGGNSAEAPHSLVVDNADQLVVLGTSSSPNFPTTGNAYDQTFNGGTPFSFYSVNYANGVDIVVTKFNISGTALVGSTFVGGTGNDGNNTAPGLRYNYGDQFRGEVICDAANNVFVASTTNSVNFPVTPGAFQTIYGGGLQDAVVFKLNQDLSGMAWSTYIGGNSADAAYGIQLNSAGIPYVSGGTLSNNFPTTPGALFTNLQGSTDGFLCRLTPTGTALTASTYMGTPQYDQNYFVQIDMFDDVYVIGQTEGTYPITPGVYSNPNSGQYIHKLNANLSATKFSTTFGSGLSKLDISLNAFLVNDCDHIYVSGWGGSINSLNGGPPQSSTNGLSTTVGSYKPTTDGSDFYLMVLDTNASQLLYATFFGGPGQEHVDGGTSRFDKKGIVYQAVCAGCGGNSNFPSTPGAWSTTNSSSNCNLAALKFDMAQLNAAISNNVPPVICAPPGTVTFTNNSNGGNQYFWDFGDGNTSTATNPTHTYNDTGVYTIMLVAMDSLSCLLSDTAYTTIKVEGPPEAEVSAPVSICPGDSTQLTSSGGDTYLWIPSAGLSNANIPNPKASPDSTTTYKVIVGNFCGFDTAEVTISVFTDPTSAMADTAICIGQSIQLSTSGGVNYQWVPATFLSNPNIANPQCTPTNTTQYTIHITDANGCEWQQDVTITVDTILPKALALNDTTICRGDTISVYGSGGSSYNWYPNYNIINAFNDTAQVFPLVSTTYYLIAKNACGQDLDSLHITVVFVDAIVCNDTAICIGTQATLYAGGGDFYEWKPAAPLNDASISNPTATIYLPTVFNVEVSNALGCKDIATVKVDTLPRPYVSAGADTVIEFYDEYQLHGYGNGLPHWSPDYFLSCTNCFKPWARPEVTTEYVFTITDTNGCKNSDTVKVVVKGNLYIPNTFTPDGDGINDIFYAYGYNLKNFKMFIFNRWGEFLFESTELVKGWDGKYKGNPCQLGTYVWKVFYTDDANVSKQATGHVNLIK